jgi:hypothetical protein
MKMPKFVKEYAKAMATQMFEDFKNHPEWRGKNFSWENFPEMTSRLAEVNIYMSRANFMDITEKRQKMIQKWVKQETHRVATELVKDLVEFK